MVLWHFLTKLKAPYYEKFSLSVFSNNNLNSPENLAPFCRKFVLEDTVLQTSPL